MYAVVEIAGRQYKVAQDAKILIPTMNAKAGDKVKFDRVLLLGGDSVSVGNPLVAGANVEAVVLDDVKGEKVTVFKKKRRKGYRLRRGHRQAYTQVQITNIVK